MFLCERIPKVCPAANGFVEVFQNVLVKLVHTAVIEGKDPTKEVQEYLRTYKAAPHKTTGKSHYKRIFSRKMPTRLPQLKVELDQVVREKHEKEKERNKRGITTRGPKGG